MAVTVQSPQVTHLPFVIGMILSLINQKMILLSLLKLGPKTGKPMDGFQLKRADLSNINLVRRNSKQGYSFRDADLYRAKLHKAHLFSIDLSGSSLMKADLSFSNLHCANLKGCNLLGVDFGRARLENIEWGEQINQEIKAREAIKQQEYDFGP